MNLFALLTVEITEAQNGELIAQRHTTQEGLFSDSRFSLSPRGSTGTMGTRLCVARGWTFTMGHHGSLRKPAVAKVIENPPWSWEPCPPVRGPVQPMDRSQ